MKIPDLDTICARADRFLCMLFRRGGARITPMEGSGKFDPKLAIQTTNLILREFDRGPLASPKPLEGSVKFDPKLATQTTNLILRELDPDRLRRKQMRDQ